MEFGKQDKCKTGNDIIAELEAFEAGYLRCIEDVLKSKTWFLEYDGKLPYPLAELTGETIRDLIQLEARKS